MTYMIHLEHSEDRCEDVRSHFQEGGERMADCYSACSGGEHGAYCFMEADNKAEAEKMCSTEFSKFGGECRVVEVDHFGGKGQFYQAGKREPGYGQESGTMHSGYGKESEKKEYGYGEQTGSKEYEKESWKPEEKKFGE